MQKSWTKFGSSRPKSSGETDNRKENEMDNIKEIKSEVAYGLKQVRAAMKELNDSFKTGTTEEQFELADLLVQTADMLRYDLNRLFDEERG